MNPLLAPLFTISLAVIYFLLCLLLPGFSPKISPMTDRLLLASASPARLKVLTQAGITPLAWPANIDEDAVRTQLETAGPPQVVTALAQAKARHIGKFLTDPNESRGEGTPRVNKAWQTLEQIPIGERLAVVGCDSMLLLNGKLRGKPHSFARALAQIHELSGASPTLYTGHCALALKRSPAGFIYENEVADYSQATLHFSEISAKEARAYAASKEPLEVAGGFTIDGLGGAFIESIKGDPHGIIGISLPLVRKLLNELGFFWPNLWNILLNESPNR